MNIISLVRTEFKNVKTGEISYGFRCFDGYTSVYWNSFTKENLDLPDKEFFLLTYATSDENVSEMLDWTLNDDCVEIDEVVYSSDEVRKWLTET